MTEARKSSGRLQLLLIAAVFFGPLLAALWLYTSGAALQPEGRANSGTLLTPIINLNDVLRESPLFDEQQDRWLLVYSNVTSCDAGCRDGLYNTRQMRLMLGREMDRLARVFLHGDSGVDTLFLAAEHEGLIALNDRAMSEYLAKKRPKDLAAGGYYLVDPQGNLVMYFDPGLEPGAVVDDIKRLLKLSRIG